MLVLYFISLTSTYFPRIFLFHVLVELFNSTNKRRKIIVSIILGDVKSYPKSDVSSAQNLKNILQTSNNVKANNNKTTKYRGCFSCCNWMMDPLLMRVYFFVLFPKCYFVFPLRDSIHIFYPNKTNHMASRDGLQR